MVSMQVAAAITIQAMWKKYKWHSWYKELRHRRHDAARRFQSLWRNYRFRNILPIIRRRQQNAAAGLIQKHLRGKVVSNMFYVQLKKCKLDSNNRDFAEMRKKLILNAVIKIIYCWKRYVKRKGQAKIKERYDAEQRKKAEREKKTKGSGGG